jgi:hypothetical protein
MPNLVLSMALLRASRTSGSAGLSVGVELCEVYAFGERLRARGGNRWCKLLLLLNIMTADLLRVFFLKVSYFLRFKILI